uniref:bifunctional phosphoserine phosphatase/homoserine phosphotransferase ThrH n=1 Tax=Vaginimicrobium propionicum TaxID=1871034 RepID=UPI000970DB59|nr:bifunctional phosphoserine phosphatase/homoserine phosphotransferase ThrH [Vaginimicrobium propionicum]
MQVACLDLEGVLVPEIWINVAEATGIKELELTTRDISDYDELMRYRLRILDEKQLKLADITSVISTLNPLPGAREFLDWLREHFQVIILSDTFYQFARPLMEKLGQPTLFCHDLEIDDQGRICDYRLRMADQKRQAVAALQRLNFKCVATGDSYNDTSMLAQADTGILFNPPAKVADEFPQFPLARDHDELRALFANVL